MKRSKRILSILLSTALLATAVITAFPAHAETTPSDFTAAFQNAEEAKPTIRWWIPETVDEDQIRAEIRQFADAGFGNIEVIYFYANGYAGGFMGATPPEGYGWEEDYWLSLYAAMIDEAVQCNIKLDLGISPIWNITSPTISSPDDSAAEVKFVSGKQEVVAGTYTGEVPFSGNKISTPKLLGVSLVKTDGAGYDFDSIKDVTAFAYQDINSSTGWSISVDIPEDGSWSLFGNWETPTGGKVDGYYTIDHYGKAGAQSIIDYWENVLIPYVGEDKIRQAIDCIFCDSLEMTGNWSRDFIETFQQEMGYDITPYLFMLAGNFGRVSETYNNTYPISDTIKNQQILRDYYEVLTKCYTQYHLKPLSEFCHKYDMQLRYQVAYGKTLELAETTLYTDIPEFEAMQIRNTIDNFRAQSGSVNMGGKQQYAIELQAERGEFAKNYQQDWDDFLTIMQRAWSVGANSQTIHGASYRGDFSGSSNGIYMDNLTWPGYESFGRTGFLSFSNNWNRLPSWEHITDYTEYISRMNSVLRQGVADVDLAIYRNDYMDNFYPEDDTYCLEDGDYIYRDAGILERLGYTYEFLCPEAMELNSAKVENGVLNANGPSYQAIILNFQTYMNTKEIETLTQFAKDGLPIIILGDIPSVSTSYSDDEAARAAAMEELMKQDCVTLVNSYNQVPKALQEYHILPDAKFSQQEEVLTHHRKDEGVDYYYVYNFGRMSTDDTTEANRDAIKPVDYEVSFVGEGIPYELDCWTGEITPISQYKVDGNRITVNVKLDSNESTVIAFASPEWGGVTAAHHVTNATGETGYQQDGTVYLKAYQDGNYIATLDNGDTKTVEAAGIPETIQLDTFDLTVKDYNKGETEIDTVYNDINIGSTKLVSWTEIPGLENAAGVGSYTTTFQLSENWDNTMGAEIDLGRVQDSFRVWINDNLLPAGNRYDTVIDISQYLKVGENTLRIDVATGLSNKLAGVYPSEGHNVVDYGLFGNDGIVTITPYKMVTVTESEQEQPSEPDNSKPELPQESQPSVDPFSKPEENSSPTTGDQTLPALLLLGIVASAGMAVVVQKRKRN